MSKYIITGIVIVLLAAIMIVLFGGYMPWNTKRARNVAEKYLSETYTEKMEYDSIRFSFIDPSLYYVSFHPQNDSSVLFTVIVYPDDFTLPENADNYITQVFSSKLEELLTPECKEIWGENASVKVASQDHLYAFQEVVGLTANTSLEELSENIKFRLFLDTDLNWSTANLESEADRIFKIGTVLKQNKIIVKELICTYYGDENNDDKKIVDLDEKFIDLGDVASLNSNAQILEILHGAA